MNTQLSHVSSTLYSLYLIQTFFWLHSLCLFTFKSFKSRSKVSVLWPSSVRLHLHLSGLSPLTSAPRSTFYDGHLASVWRPVHLLRFVSVPLVFTLIWAGNWERSEAEPYTCRSLQTHLCVTSLKRLSDHIVAVNLSTGPESPRRLHSPSVKLIRL